LDYDMQDAGWSLIGSNTGVSSGTDTSRSWTTRFSGSSYQWYVTVSDGTTTTVGPVWDFKTKPYDVITLDTLGGNESQGRGIDGTYAAGFAKKSDGTFEAVRWTIGSSTPTSLGSLGYGSAGYATDGWRAVGQAWTSGGVSHGFIWRSDYTPQMRECFALGGAAYNAIIVAANGHTVGYSQNSLGTNRATGWYYDSTTGWDMGTLAGTNASYFSYAYGINSSYQVVGASQTTNGVTRGFRTGIYGSVTAATDLGTLGGANSEAFAIDYNGRVVGRAQLANGEWRAFSYDTNMANLGTLGTDYTGNFSSAYGLAIVPTYVSFIVGAAQSKTNVAHAVISDGTTMVDLNGTIAPGSGWKLTTAHGINSSGRIVGTGTLSGQTRGFVLVP